MTNLSLDWIGGFFDADGSICLSKRSRKREGRAAFEFVPALTISQSDRGILEEIGKVLDASVYLHSRAGKWNDFGVISNRDSFNLRADNAKAIEIAKTLIGVTHVKRQELEEVVEFYERYNNYTKGWARWNHKTGEYDRRYAELVAAGDACRAKLNLLRTYKDTLYVPLQEK